MTAPGWRGGGAPSAWSVGALLLAAQDLLAARFGAVAVAGEISGFARAPSGHCYFTLKDGTGAPALLRCAMFRRAAMLAAFQPADGQRVEVRGRLAVYEARGELQMIVEAIQRVGEGALYEEFLRRKARLEAEGLFDPAGKRALPAVPRVLGVVTSTAGAALHDVLTALRRRAPHVAVVVYPCLVQGAQAPASIVEALEAAVRRAEVDALIVCRGGGSLEDLWAYNDERVVRAIAHSALPVVCGVGHETDLTLAELAADLRAATPTAAAELACADRAGLRAALAALALTLRQRMHRRVESRAQGLDALAQRFGRPREALSVQRHALLTMATRLRSALSLTVERRHQALAQAARRWQGARAGTLAGEHRRLERLQARLAALDPARVLARGYAWVEGADGRPITSVAGLEVGMSIDAVWADGRASAEVKQIEPEGVTRPSKG